MAPKKNTQNVGFRLPTELVNKIDAEAERNYRDRTGEIIHALKSYYEMQDERGELLEKINEITEKIETLEKEVRELKGS